MTWPKVAIFECVEKVDTLKVQDSDCEITYIDLSSVSKKNKIIKTDTLQKMLVGNAPSRAKQIVKSSDVLVSTVRPNLNGVAKVPTCLNGAIASTGYSVLRAKKEILDSRFLYYWVQSDTFVRDMVSNANGANYPAVTDKIVKKSSIPLPPLSIQKQIAAVLEKADKLRQQSQQMEHELNSLARSMFLDMFGDPILNPKGWARDRLGNRLSIKHGYAFSGEYFTSEGEYILLTPGNFFEEGGYRDRKEKQKYYIGEIPEGYILEKNNLLVAMTEQTEGLLGSSMFVPESNKFLHNQRLGLVDLEIGQNEYFYYFLFNNLSVRKSIQASSTGLKVKHTSPKKIEAIEVGIPPVDMQQKFEARVKKIWEQIKIIRKTATESDLHFNSLMQRAFKGVLEIKDVA